MFWSYEGTELSSGCGVRRNLRFLRRNLHNLQWKHGQVGAVIRTFLTAIPVGDKIISGVTGVTSV